MYISMATGRWQRTELRDLIETTFHNKDSVHHMIYEPTCVPNDQAHEDTQLLGDFTMSLIGHRAWTDAWNWVPPNSGAPLMSSDTALAARTMAKLQAEWAILLRLEAAAQFNKQAKKLRKAIYWANQVQTVVQFVDR